MWASKMHFRALADAFYWFITVVPKLRWPAAFSNSRKVRNKIWRNSKHTNKEEIEATKTKILLVDECCRFPNRAFAMPLFMVWLINTVEVHF